MTINTVRNSTAMVLVLGHIVAILLVFMLLGDYFERMDEKLEIVLILSPLTGLFALAALKHVLASKGVLGRSRRVETVYATFCIGIPLIFVSFVIYTIARYPFGVAESPQGLRMTLAAIEVALGGLLGTIAEHLFQADLKELKSSESARVRTT